MSPVHFLLVDDEELFAETVAKRLRLKGFIVDVATSGAEALDRLETCNTVDIVVLDIQMPGQDGVTTLERIKAEYPLVEVIMLTGHATVQSAVDAMKIGAFDYLIKPYDMEELLEKAGSAVSRKRDREEKIADARSRPYISDREREDLISEILKE